MVAGLDAAIDAKDPYTCGHSDRVARVSVRLAKELGCDRKAVNTIYLSGCCTTWARSGSTITCCASRAPTRPNMSTSRPTPRSASKISSDIKQLDEVLPVVLHHHEQWDGKGYPRGLAGDQIPLLARIVAVADSFDAMGSDRPYRQGMVDEKLDGIMRDGAGKQWDASVVEAFFCPRRRARDRAQEGQEPDARRPRVGIARRGYFSARRRTDWRTMFSWLECPAAAPRRRCQR